jgi:hypothetical protein
MCIRGRGFGRASAAEAFHAPRTCCVPFRKLTHDQPSVALKV